LIGCIDSDFSHSIDDIKSTSGYIFHLGSGVISWESKKYTIMTIASVEAEYVATIVVACQAIWLHRVLGDLQQGQEEPTPLYCDNNSTISPSKDHAFHKKKKTY
jgi:hypothetical protein